jgi:hypothetical protein
MIIPKRLSLAVLVFNALCLVPVAFIVVKHIRNFVEGWNYLLAAVLLRIVGSIADIVAWTRLQNDGNLPNESLFTLSIVSRSITAFLLLLNVLGIFYRL